MDGLRGPVLSGTVFYMKRKALFGTPKQEEGTFTGYLLHCEGRTSVYCFPSNPSFLGCATMNMKDATVQTMKWCSGLFQVGVSKFSPLTYGISRMSPLQSMCYAYFTLHPLYAISFLIMASSLNPWFAVFVIVYVSALCQHLVEVLISGGTIKTWWNEQRIWMIKSVKGSLFGCLDVVMKSIGATKTSFRLTNKVIDSDQQKKYDKGNFNFKGATIFMIPLFMLVIWNLGCFILGARRVYIDKSLEEMFGQVYISFSILVLGYPILEGII
ncbi:hypothetical protein MKX01_034985 [Papaver californicum]|nr:hypothetical protein MKX01_034985 [Papaver californicum]